MIKKSKKPGPDLAERVADLIDKGASPRDAEQEADAPPGYSVDDLVKQKIEALKKTKFFSAEAQRHIIRQNEFLAYLSVSALAEALLAAGKVKDAMEAFELARKIAANRASDPQVGLTATPQVVIELDMKPVKEALEKLQAPETEFGWEITDGSENIESGSSK